MSMGTHNRLGPKRSLQKGRLLWRDKLAEESWVTRKCRASSSLVSSRCKWEASVTCSERNHLSCSCWWAGARLFCLMICSMSLYFYTRMFLYSWMWQHRFMLNVLDDNDSCADVISEISRLHTFHYRTRLYFMIFYVLLTVHLSTM